MRVVFLPSDLDGTGHYRLLNPMRELRRRGWVCGMAAHIVTQDPAGKVVVRYGEWARDGDKLVPAGFIEDWLLRAPFDVLYMGQRDEPWWPGLIGRLQAQGKRVLVDSDDCWLNLPAWNPGSRKPRAEVDAMLAQIAAADGLSVATPALAELYRDYQPNVRVIRNRLDWRMWADATPAYEVQRRRERVGWMGELKWRAGDLRVLQGVLGPWLEQHPEVEFVAAGDPRVHDLLGVPRSQRVTTNRINFWDGDLADITATFDIGLIPLDLSDEKARRLNECKSHLKGAEYAACGIPCIASPSESYRWWVDGANGALAANPRQWRDGLDLLLDDTVRRDMGQHARAKAELHAIQAGGVDEWADWIESRGAHPHAALQGVAA